MGNNEICEKEVLTLTWNYFQFHAQQRLTYINFFVILSSALTVAQYTIISSSARIYFVGILLGVIECIISYVFYKFDERNKFLTKHAEDTIKLIESNYSFSEKEDYLENVKLFTVEEIITNLNMENNKSFLSHSQSYKLLLIFYSLVGIIGSLISLILTINIR
jgi:hypothetical protein